MSEIWGGNDIREAIEHTRNPRRDIKPPVEMQDWEQLRDTFALMDLGTQILPGLDECFDHEKITDREVDSIGFLSKSRKTLSIVTTHSPRDPSEVKLSELSNTELSELRSHETGMSQHKVDELYAEFAKRVELRFSEHFKCEKSTTAQNSEPTTTLLAQGSSFSHDAE